MQTMLLENVARRKKWMGPFIQTFETPLSEYWDNLYGFDVIKFDEFITPKAHESTADAVARKYGEPALAIIRGLIG